MSGERQWLVRIDYFDALTHWTEERKVWAYDKETAVAMAATMAGHAWKRIQKAHAEEVP